MLDFECKTSFEHSQQAKFLRIGDTAPSQSKPRKSRLNQTRIVAEGKENLKTSFNCLADIQQRQERVRQLLEIVRIMEEEWGLAMPPMILSVSGKTALSLSLSLSLSLALSLFLSLSLMLW